MLLEILKNFVCNQMVSKIKILQWLLRTCSMIFPLYFIELQILGSNGKTSGFSEFLSFNSDGQNSIYLRGWYKLYIVKERFRCSRFSRSSRSRKKIFSDFKNI